MKVHVENGSKRGEQDISPFCIPAPHVSGPGIVFYIKINKSVYPVFIQLKLRQVLEGSDIEKALATDYCPTGVYISMVITYLAEVVKFQIICPDPEPELDGLQHVSINIDYNNFSQIFPSDMFSSSTDLSNIIDQQLMNQPRN
ncbi:hypothetical protein MVEG_08255 [Podila verticillata NRRL 6337]|nr:hypothetical protein MVEG_08255 [Podila verticillata NRRL 6337]